MTSTRTHFHDADLTHRWAVEHRVPVVTSLPEWLYEAALLVPNFPEGGSPDPDSFRLRETVWPTDAEAEVIGSYIDYRMTYYREGYHRRERALDVDSSTNTVTFTKTDKGWTYSRLTYRGSFYPRYDQPQFEPTREGLIALITSLHLYGSGTEVYEPFATWMAEHPDVWALPEA
jgi:hypothetical protein